MFHKNKHSFGYDLQFFSWQPSPVQSKRVVSRILRFLHKCSIFCVIKCSLKIQIAIKYVHCEMRPYLQRNNSYIRGALYSNSMCQSAGPLSKEYNKLWFFNPISLCIVNYSGQFY